MISLIRAHTRDTSEPYVLSDKELEPFITTALAHYTKRRPRFDGAVYTVDNVPGVDQPFLAMYVAALAIRSITSDTKKSEQLLKYTLNDVVTIDASEVNKFMSDLRSNAAYLQKEYESNLATETTLTKERGAFMTFG